MDNNDSNIKSQQTGGLKLMTVFIAVLALHVVVIGGFTVYHLMSGGSTDADLTLDKNHKGSKADGSTLTDGTTPDANAPDKSASSTTAPTPPTEVATIPANPPAPTTPSEVVAPPPGPAPILMPAPATTASTPAPTTPTPSTEMANMAPPSSTPTISPELAPPAEPAPATAPVTPAPLAPLAAGPVHMPPAEMAPAAPTVHEQIYTVKITDSYKKIAHAHHITVAQLKEANHIKGDVLHTGQKLVIPSSRTMVAATASNTALESTSTGPILSEPAPASTESLAAVPSGASHSHLYTVVKGDTLIKIAHRFKTTASAIMSENNITDPSKLSIGKKLKIPSRESRSAGNTAPPSSQPGQVRAKPEAPSGQLANFVP